MDSQLKQWLDVLTRLGPLFNMLTMLGVGLTAVATIALARATARYMKQQNDRAQSAQRTELFLQLRERAISSERIERRRRVIALLMHLKEEGICLKKLEYSPDIALYMNDYNWIGKLVKDGMLTEDYAWATYGRNLLILYPMLKPYIDKERLEHDTVWQGVSYLYKKFKQRHEDALKKSTKRQPGPINDPIQDKDSEVVKKVLERWLNPSTTTLVVNEGKREKINIDELLRM